MVGVVWTYNVYTVSQVDVYHVVVVVAVEPGTHNKHQRSAHRHVVIQGHTDQKHNKIKQ